MQSTDNHARLIFFLGPHFGVLFLKIIKNYCNYLNYKVVTYSEESDSYYGYESVIHYCKENNIDFLDTSTHRSHVLNFCTQFNPTMILCGYYAKILPVEILDLAQDGAYNIHPGKLPYYRGPFPTAWAILNNEDSFGITIHLMDHQIDTGPICAQKTFSILPEENGYELYLRSMQLSADILYSFIPSLLDKSFETIEQTEVGSYYGRIASHYHIDWSNKSKLIKNLVRVHSKPYFPAYSFIKNKIVLINRCSILNDIKIKLQEPGKITEITDKDVFYVTCGDGIIEVTDYEVSPINGNQRKVDFIRRGMRLF